MTKKEKELLLIDISARLLYGVIVDIKYNKEHGSSDRLRICSEGSLTLNTDLIGLCIEEEIHLKPYLRPLSSMTDEEVEELFGIIHKKHKLIKYEKTEDRVRFNSTDENGVFGCFVFFYDIESKFISIELLDWLNAHHFDYRGLIEKGLAIEAPKGMYK